MAQRATSRPTRAGSHVLPIWQLEHVTVVRLMAIEDYEFTSQVDQYTIHPGITYDTTRDFALRSMVEAGLGVSILAELMLKKIKGYAVCIRPIVPAVQRDIGVVYKDLGTMPIASRRFLTYLQEHVPGSEPGSPPSGGK